MRDLQTPVNTLLDDQEIVDGIVIEHTQPEPLPIATISSIIRNNLPEVKLVTIEPKPSFWSEEGNERFMYGLQLSLFVGQEMRCFSGILSLHREPIVIADLLDALSDAMSQVTENECSCCGITSAWPTFETLAARITEAVEALS